MRSLSVTILALLLFSCAKENKPKKPLYGYIEIYSAKTAKVIELGHNITSTVTLVEPQLYGDLTFLGFEIIENPAKVFSIKAKALFKPWEQQILLPVYQTFDTTISLKTRSPGLHILNFYSSTVLLKSDTVQVN